MHFGRQQCVAIEAPQSRLLAEEVRHGRVQLDQGDAFNAGVPERLAHRHAVTAAQHRDFLRRAMRAHHRMHERLVVAVLVTLGKLQVAVEKQPVAAAAVRHHDALVGRGGGEDHAVLVEMVFGQRGDLLCAHKAGAQRTHHQQARCHVRPEMPQLMAKQP